MSVIQPSQMAMGDRKSREIPIRQKDPKDRLIHHGDRLEKLGILNPPFPIILVGGTNGKGSTTHMIGRIFMEAGYKVGINTSPHLIHFNERVRINEVPISDGDLDTYLEKINADFADFPLGYNEYSFLMGLYAFIAQQVDIAIFEIGLGGRLDPANLMPAKISVITNIDLDHTEILGDTLEKIAIEKAEIIKLHQPSICGHIPCNKALEAIQHKAIERHSNLYIAEQDFSFETFQKQYHLPHPHILPCNAALGIQAALLASSFLPLEARQNSAPDSLLQKILSRAVENTTVPGRLQEMIWQKKKLLLDVSHNPGGCQNLKNYLEKHPIAGKNYGIFAVSETKDSRQMINIMSEIIDHWILPKIQNLQDPPNLWDQFPFRDPSTLEHKDLQNLTDVLKFLEITVTPADRIIVFGSFYLAGEFLCALNLAS